VPANDFCKIIVPCAIRPLSRLHNGVETARTFQQFVFRHQRAILRQARIYFVIVTCILCDWAWCASTNRTSACAFIDPGIQFCRFVLLPVRSNIYVRKCADYITIMFYELLNLILRVCTNQRDILVNEKKYRLTLISSCLIKF